MHGSNRLLLCSVGTTICIIDLLKISKKF